MVSLNTSLYTGFSGVQSAQTGLNITGNNIANVNTEGYSRQSVVTTERGIMRSGNIVQGIGSTVTHVMAAREMLADEQLTRQMGRHAYQEELAAGLNELEALLAETDDTGIGHALSEFFGSMEAATLRPADIGTRQELLAQGDALAAEIRSRDGDLYDQQAQLNDDLTDLTNEVNEITERIENINRKISSQVRPAQDLIDQRFAEINRLSELVSVETFTLTNNQLQVNLAGANVILVGREIRNTLGTQPNAINNSISDITINNKGNTNVITSGVNGGKIGAKLLLRDTDIQGVRDKLDELAAGLIIQVNTLHQGGTDLNGNTNLRFFDPDNASVLGATAVGVVDPARYRGLAGGIRISSDLESSPGVVDPTRIALSSTGSVGDNGVAIAMANLRNSSSLIDADRDGDPSNDGSETLEKFYNTTLSGTGRKVRSANDSLDTQIALLEQAEVRREQISGVSLDEEAVQLSQFQRAFEASSRYLNIINQLTADIINKLG